MSTFPDCPSLDWITLISFSSVINSEGTSSSSSISAWPKVETFSRIITFGFNVWAIFNVWNASLPSESGEIVTLVPSGSPSGKGSDSSLLTVIAVSPLISVKCLLILTTNFYWILQVLLDENKCHIVYQIKKKPGKKILQLKHLR